MSASGQTPPILAIHDLTLGFRFHRGDVQALAGVSIEVGEREIVGIVGESGCGKSITALSVMGLLPEGTARIMGGRIEFRGNDLLTIPARERRRMRGRDIAMVFQEPMTSLNPIMPVGEQIAEPIRLHLGLKGAAVTEHALQVLDKVGIPRSRNILPDYPHQLSGGMRQRVMIAVALACNPSLIIADEPTTALDVTIQGQILDLMLEARDTFGTSILFITHDLGVVAEICDRVVVMYAGKVVETGYTDDVLSSPGHPYTQGLMGSLPSLDDRQERLATIPGSVPALLNMPQGCRFRPRCPHGDDRCRRDPPSETIGDRRIECWKAKQIGETQHG